MRRKPVESWVPYGKKAASVRAWCEDFHRIVAADPPHGVGLLPGSVVCKEVALPVAFRNGPAFRRAHAVLVEDGGDYRYTVLLVETTSSPLVTAPIFWAFENADTSPSSDDPWPTSLEGLREEEGRLVAIVARWAPPRKDLTRMRLVRTAIVCEPSPLLCEEISTDFEHPLLGFKEVPVVPSKDPFATDWRKVPWQSVREARVERDGRVVLGGDGGP